MEPEGSFSASDPVHAMKLEKMKVGITGFSGNKKKRTGGVNVQRI